jgi:hypothetical protein
MQRPGRDGWCLHGADSCAKRFYFGQHPFLVEGNNAVYRVNTSNDFPNNMRVHFLSTNPSDRALLRFRVFKTNFDMRVVHNGREISPLNRLPNVASDARGANIFDGRNIFHLLVQGSANAQEQFYDIRTLDVVKLNLTFSLSLNEFFDERKLVSNLAILLDIPASKIKVVQVHPINVQSVVVANRDKLKSNSEVGKTILGLAGGSDDSASRRREADGFTAEIAIGTEADGDSRLPTSDEEEASQASFFNEVIEAFANASTSGKLKEALVEAGVVLATVSVLPPASVGVSQQSVFALEVEPAASGTGSGGGSPAALVGAVGAVVAVVALLAAVVVLKHQRRLKKREEEAAAGGKAATMARKEATVISLDTLGEPVSGDAAVPLKQRSTASLLSRLAHSLRGPSPVGVEPEDATPKLERMSSRRGLAPLQLAVDEASLAAADGAATSADSGKFNTLKRLQVASVQQRIQALQDFKCRVISRKTWEYVGSGSNDFWHPGVSRAQAEAILREKATGHFLCYGRKPVMLSVAVRGHGHEVKVRHEELEFDASLGFRLSAKSDQPWHSDLASLVAHYREPHAGVPFVLVDEEENDVYFTMPNPMTNMTSGQSLGLQAPEYTDDDFHKLDRRTSVRLKYAREPPAEDEFVPVEVAYTRRPSLRTQESLAQFEPLTLAQVVEDLE